MGWDGHYRHEVEVEAVEAEAEAVKAEVEVEEVKGVEAEVLMEVENRHSLALKRSNYRNRVAVLHL